MDKTGFNMGNVNNPRNIQETSKKHPRRNIWINQQVKNNIIKFPERYRFQLNKDELNFVMSKNLTSPKNFFSGQNGGTRKLPYAFTEQGIYANDCII